MVLDPNQAEQPGRICSLYLILAGSKRLDSISISRIFILITFLCPDWRT